MASSAETRKKMRDKKKRYSLVFAAFSALFWWWPDHVIRISYYFSTSNSWRCRDEADCQSKRPLEMKREERSHFQWTSFAQSGLAEKIKGIFHLNITSVPGWTTDLDGAPTRLCSHLLHRVLEEVSHFFGTGYDFQDSVCMWVRLERALAKAEMHLPTLNFAPKIFTVDALIKGNVQWQRHGQSANSQKVLDSINRHLCLLTSE